MLMMYIASKRALQINIYFYQVTGVQYVNGDRSEFGPYVGPVLVDYVDNSYKYDVQVRTFCLGYFRICFGFIDTGRGLYFKFYTQNSMLS